MILEALDATNMYPNRDVFTEKVVCPCLKDRDLTKSAARERATNISGTYIGMIQRAAKKIKRRFSVILSPRVSINPPIAVTDFVFLAM